MTEKARGARRWLGRLLPWAACVDRLSERLGRLLWGCMLLMVCLGAFNALARYLGRGLGVQLSSNAWLELQWYLFSAIFLLGAAYTLRHGGHVRVDVFYDRLPVRARRWIDLCGHLLFLLPFTAFVAWLSLPPVVDSFRRLEVSPDPGGLPRYVIKAVVPLAFVLLFLQGLAETVKTLARLHDVELPEEREEAGHL